MNSPAPGAILTHCPYCAMQCGMSLAEENGRWTVAARDFPTNRGGLCRKGWAAAELLHAPDRLQTPLMRDRKSEALRPVTWPEALDRIAARFSATAAESGPNAIAVFDPPGFVDVEGTVKTVDSGADTVGLELAKTGEGGRRLSAKLSGAVAADSHLVRYTRRVDDPQLLAGYALRAILEESGLKVSGEVKLSAATSGGKEPKEGKGGVLARHESEPLSTLLYALGKNSDNFYAEMIFKSLAAEAKARPAKSQDSAEIVTSFIDKNGLGDTGFVVKNGSGLFDANRTTAHSMAKLLRFAWQDPGLRSEFVAQLSIGGVDGTLHKRFRDLRAHRAVRAKTGTLDDAIALSGYVLGPPGKGTIAFAILFNKVSGRGGAARAAADKLVEAVHERQWR